MVEGTSVVPEDMLPQPAARLKLPAEEQRRRTFFPRASVDPTP
jgi:hypothetical protein